MRKPIIAGNWKMNNTANEGVKLIEALKPLVKDANCDVAVCVPAIDVPAAAEALRARTSRSARKTCTSRKRAPLREKFPPIC